ncbi:DUF465 domain-containing protein [Aureimonas sp. SA4125]|uniref:YdcH family protein n=1 Tax=Aureimonas sp. SA4125 TaxID=2826993 RepID=UPI001CC470F7|nr:DUF465 domain-containing protein [Aureimonas sp. SA4125]BDA83519.1 DUF465 domain-containing protein [Aureimonas sp. SA4125]
MSLHVHIATLENRHSALESEIAAAKTKPAMDDAQIRELKRRKLQLKDELERLRNS